MSSHEIKKENCVSCNKKTHVNEDVDIEFRDYYIRGVGQLCQECYIDIYEKYSKKIKKQTRRVTKKQKYIK